MVGRAHMAAGDPQSLKPQGTSPLQERGEQTSPGRPPKTDREGETQGVCELQAPPALGPPGRHCPPEHCGASTDSGVHCWMAKAERPWRGRSSFPESLCQGGKTRLRVGVGLAPSWVGSFLLACRPWVLTLRPGRDPPVKGSLPLFLSHPFLRPTESQHPSTHHRGSRRDPHSKT